MSKDRKKIGEVVAMVKFPLYEGDKVTTVGDWFQYKEPGISEEGELSSCVRPCELIHGQVILSKYIDTVEIEGITFKLLLDPASGGVILDCWFTEDGYSIPLSTALQHLNITVEEVWKK